MKLIENLYRDPGIDNCIAKMVREDLREDFKQELFVILIQQKEKLESIPKEQVRYYIVRLIINLATQSRNVFLKTYYRPENLVSYEPEPDRIKSVDIEPDMEEEKRWAKLINKLENINKGMAHLEPIGKTGEGFYFGAIIKLLQMHKSIRKVSRQTGLPATTICNAMKAIRKYLKDV